MATVIKMWAFVALGVLAVLAFLSYGPRIIPGLLAMWFPNIIWKVDIAAPIIALTFDDGPDARYTPRLLDILANYNVRATFFLVGERARRYPEIVAAIRASGHEVGNHSDSWSRTLGLDCKTFRKDLLRAEETLGIANERVKFFRPAGSVMRPCHARVLKELGYTCVLGSGYAFDPYRPPVRFIVWLIEKSMRPGAIIVLHDSGGDRSNTLGAIPAIVARARKRGLNFATLSDLLAVAQGVGSADEVTNRKSQPDGFQ